ncbi:MAG: hypothetical protein U0935_19920 [Pirellulales bacterium]
MRIPSVGGWLLAVVVVLLTGCGASLVPVQGKVSVDGNPLDTGYVSYHPAGAKEQLEAQIGRASIEADGSYKLSTDGKPGVPPGKYRVVVTAGKPSNPSDPYSVPVSLVDAKFTLPESTPLEVEVSSSAGAGAYDLKVTK